MYSFLLCCLPEPKYDTLRETSCCIQAHVLNSDTYNTSQGKVYVHREGRHGAPHKKMSKMFPEILFNWQHCIQATTGLNTHRNVLYRKPFISAHDDT